MPKEFPRTKRVGEQIQRELAELIRRELQDPRVRMATVTAVEVTRDLAHAKVFVSVLGDTSEAEQALKALQGAAGLLRHHLGHALTTRTVPELRFLRDTSFEQGDRISQLLGELDERDEKIRDGS